MGKNSNENKKQKKKKRIEQEYISTFSNYWI